MAFFYRTKRLLTRKNTTAKMPFPRLPGDAARAFFFAAPAKKHILSRRAHRACFFPFTMRI